MLAVSRSPSVNTYNYPPHLDGHLISKVLQGSTEWKCVDRSGRQIYHSSDLIL